MWLVMVGDDEHEGPAAIYSDEEQAKLYVERLTKHSEYLGETNMSSRYFEMGVDDIDPLPEVVEYSWLVYFKPDGTFHGMHGMLPFSELPKRELSVTPIHFPGKPLICVGAIYASTREEAIQEARKHL